LAIDSLQISFEPNTRQVILHFLPSRSYLIFSLYFKLPEYNLYLTYLCMKCCSQQCACTSVVQLCMASDTYMCIVYLCEGHGHKETLDIKHAPYCLCLQRILRFSNGFVGKIVIIQYRVKIDEYQFVLIVMPDHFFSFLIKIF